MIRKNIIINLLISIIFFIVLIFNFNNTKKMFNMEKESENRYYNYCINNNIKTDGCNETILNHNKENGVDAITFYKIMTISGKTNYLNYTLIILISLCSCFTVCKLYKNKSIVNFLDRKKFSSVKIKMLLKCYMSSLVIIIPIILLWILCFINTCSVNYAYAIKNFPIFWHVNYSPYLYVIFYIIAISLFCLFFINISLIIARKNHNIVVVVIESFLTFVGIDIFIEVVFGWIISNILYGEFTSRFNILNILSVGYAKNLNEMIILPLILYVISFVILYFTYKNKEKFIIDVEKNN